MEEQIKKIIEAGVQAPSGENCQPWRFAVTGQKIDIYNVPERDESLYNFNQQAAFVAHGAVLENMIIAAGSLGYAAKIELFPDGAEPDLIARLTLQAFGSKKEPLAEFIAKRVTNRKPYKKVPLTDQQRSSLAATADEIGTGKIVIVQDNAKKNNLAQAVSCADQILFENIHAHSFFYKHLLVNEKENVQKSIGLYIKTLEVPPPVVPIFRLCSNWSFLRFMNTALRFSRTTAKLNSKLYASSGAFAAIVLDSLTSHDFLAAGRIMQRFWLKATQLGLSLQPLTGILFLMQRIRAGQTKELSPEHIEMIKFSYETISQVFGVDQGYIVLMFRLGADGQPSARSTRLPPQVRFLNS